MKIELLGNNVFRNQEWFYFVYKIDLSIFRFKAVVGYYEESEDVGKYFDTALCDWFSLDILKNALAVGNIDIDLSNEDVNYKLEQIAESFSCIENQVYYNQDDESILYTRKDNGDTITCEVFMLLNEKYECASYHDFKICELNNYKHIGFVHEEYSDIESITSFIENYKLGEII